VIRWPRNTVVNIINKAHMLADAVYPDGLSMNTVVAKM